MLLLAILAIFHLCLSRISPQHIYIVQFRPFRRFLPSLNETYIFFILVFSDPILFCLFLFLSSTFPPSIFLLCLSLHILYFVFLLLSLPLSVFYFLSLPVFHYISPALLFIFSFVCLIFELLLSLFSCVLFCIFYLSISCLPFLLIILSFSFSLVFLRLFFFLLSLIILF